MLLALAVVATVAAPGWAKVITAPDAERWRSVGGLAALVEAAWYEGEARERGIGVSAAEAREAADEEPRGGLTRADVVYRARVGLLAARIKSQIAQPAALGVTPEQIDAYVAAHPRLLPARRRARIVVTPSRAQAEALRRALSRGLTWRSAARRHGGSGAPRTVANETRLEHAIHRAPRNRVTRYGNAVFKVVAILPPRRLPLAQQRAAAWEVLASEAQRAAIAAWLPTFQAKWRERTTYAAG